MPRNVQRKTGHVIRPRRFPMASLCARKCAPSKPLPQPINSDDEVQNTSSDDDLDMIIESEDTSGSPVEPDPEPKMSQDLIEKRYSLRKQGLNPDAPVHPDTNKPEKRKRVTHYTPKQAPRMRAPSHQVFLASDTDEESVPHKKPRLEKKTGVKTEQEAKQLQRMVRELQAGVCTIRSWLRDEKLDKVMPGYIHDVFRKVPHLASEYEPEEESETDDGVDEDDDDEEEEEEVEEE